MSSFWKGKRVLVTGHTGFVGSWLSCVLKFNEADVTGFSLREEEGSLYEKIKDNLKINNVYGDLRDGSIISNCIKELKPEIVFHIAAFGFIKECHEDADRAYTTNVTGTLNLLNALRECNDVDKLIVASSDKVYLNRGLHSCLFTETDSLGGMDIYSASKTCEDILVQSFYDSYFSHSKKSVCIVRPSNIIGGGDHNLHRLIPGIFCDLNSGKKPEIRNLYSVRPWQNILDITDAYLTLAQKTKDGCLIYNVGPEKTGIKTVAEIVDYVTYLYGKKGYKKSNDDSEAKEMGYLGLSIEKIKKDIGWKPRRTLEQTLDEIYDFYKSDDGLCTYELCMKQIKRYYDEKYGE